MADNTTTLGEIAAEAFVPNETDNTHCYQATYRMALSAQSSVQLTKQAAERETGWIAGRPTWPYMGMLAMAERGLRVNSIEFLNIPEFTQDPHMALGKMIDDTQVLKEVVDTTDLAREAAVASECMKHKGITMTAKIPTLMDIRDALEAGGILICNVNARMLDGAKGYAPHFVLVSGTHNGDLVVQNPGLPPHVNQHVLPQRFEAAWYFPDERLGNMIAVFKD